MVIEFLIIYGALVASGIILCSHISESNGLLDRILLLRERSEDNEACPQIGCIDEAGRYFWSKESYFTSGWESEVMPCLEREKGELAKERSALDRRVRKHRILRSLAKALRLKYFDLSTEHESLRRREILLSVAIKTELERMGAARAKRNFQSIL